MHKSVGFYNFIYKSLFAFLFFFPSFSLSSLVARNRRALVSSRTFSPPWRPKQASSSKSNSKVYTNFKFFVPPISHTRTKFDVGFQFWLITSRSSASDCSYCVVQIFVRTRSTGSRPVWSTRPISSNGALQLLDRRILFSTCFISFYFLFPELKFCVFLDYYLGGFRFLWGIVRRILNFFFFGYRIESRAGLWFSWGKVCVFD